MNTSNQNTAHSIYRNLFIGSIISCLITAIVMVWSIVSIRADINHIEKLMTRSSASSSTIMGDHDMHDPMTMSMTDMGKMLEGKTGDALDKAFLEGMIPHHQGAVDMAKYLVNAKHPELQKMGQDIIIAQEKEINQMKQWMADWGYTSSGIDNTSPVTLDPEQEMMKEHCKTMPDMVGCEKYKQ